MNTQAQPQSDGYEEKYGPLANCTRVDDFFVAAEQAIESKDPERIKRAIYSDEAFLELSRLKDKLISDLVSLPSPAASDTFGNYGKLAEIATEIGRASQEHLSAFVISHRIIAHHIYEVELTINSMIRFRGRPQSVIDQAILVAISRQEEPIQ